MIITFHRTIPISKILEELAATYGTPAKLARLARRDPTKRPILDEWRWHLQAKDKSELIKTEHSVVFHDPRDFVRTWTPRRLAIYQYLRAHTDVASLRQLAIQMGRNYRNVYEDAQILSKAQVIALDRHASSLVPRVLADAITITV